MEPLEHLKQAMKDHDTLIEIKTELHILAGDVREMKDGVNAKLSDLQQQKLDKEEGMRLYNESLEVRKDHETRIKLLEKMADESAGAIKAQIKSARNINLIVTICSFLLAVILALAG